MAIAAINAQAGDVMLVAEGHRLRLSDPGIRDVGRALELPQSPAQSPDDNRNYYQRSAGNGIAAAWKNLHLSRVFRSAGSVAPLPALHIFMIASHSSVTVFTKTGDYSSCDTLLCSFYFSN